MPVAWVRPWLAADLHRGQAQHDSAAVRARVAEAGRRQAHDQHGRGPLDDGVRRPDAHRHVADPCGRQPADQDGRRARPEDRAADVGNRRQARRDHRALVHVGQSGCGRHRTPDQLIFTSVPWIVRMPLVLSSAMAFAFTECWAFACSLMLSAFSEESAVASIERLAPALMLMLVLAVMVIADALSMAMPLLLSVIELLLLSLMAISPVLSLSVMLCPPGVLISNTTSLSSNVTSIFERVTIAFLSLSLFG